MGSKSSKMGSGYEHFHPKIDSAPLKANKNYYQIWGILYSKETNIDGLVRLFDACLGRYLSLTNSD